MFDKHRMTSAAFAAAVKSINTRGKKLQQDVHAACVAALLFALPENQGGNLNSTPAMQLCQNLPAGLPRNKLVNWFVTFTNIRITVSNGGKTWAVKLLVPGDDGFRHFTDEDIQAAIDTPYWDNEPEKDIAPLDMDKMIAALIKKATTAIADGKVTNPDKAKTQLAALKKLAPAK